MTGPSFVESLPETERRDLREICDRAREELREMAGKRLLVTGGAGFLGYYLVRAPLAWNELVAAPSGQAPIEVVVLDNFLRGVPAWLEAVRSNGAVTLVEHDIIAPLPSDFAPCDLILHAASIASPIVYRKYPIETMDANVVGLRRLLEHCRERRETERPVEAFLFFSTSEIYGDPTPENIPTPETYPGRVSCTGPRACYDESKRFGETLSVHFASEFGLPIRIVRPFNNYGPGLKLDDGRLLPDFASAVLEGRDLVMFSDGSPTRTFCYISDAVVGYFKVLMRGRDGEPYNIGADRPETSVAELAERVASVAADLFGYDGRVQRAEHADADYLVDNPNRRCPDIGKARGELGFEPVVTLDDGLRRALGWYHQQGRVARGESEVSTPAN